MIILVKFEEYIRKNISSQIQVDQKELEDVTAKKIEYESAKYRNELILKQRNRLKGQINQS